MNNTVNTKPQVLELLEIFYNEIDTYMYVQAPMGKAGARQIVNDLMGDLSYLRYELVTNKINIKEALLQITSLRCYFDNFTLQMESKQDLRSYAMMRCAI